jgi:glycosyltransferase involved in cell wall biosynthesis
VRRTWDLSGIVAPNFTILLPVFGPPNLLPFAIESVLAQTVAEFELFVVSDGAPPETIDCANEFARRDPRVKVFIFSKGARIGEANWHAALGSASGRYVAHLEDDDLWFPNHLEELEKLLLTVDFGHTIYVRAHSDGQIEALPADLGIAEFRERMLAEHFNRIGYSVCGYRLDAYRRLPDGWVPAPPTIWPDLYMWRKFLRMHDFSFGTRMVITAVGLPAHFREHMSSEARIRESRAWLQRVLDASERAEFVKAAWRSIVRKNLDYELKVQPELTTARDELWGELSRMTASRDELHGELGRMTAARDEFQGELGRMTAARDEFQGELGRMTASRDELRGELGRMTAARDKFQGELGRIVRSKF